MLHGALGWSSGVVDCHSQAVRAAPRHILDQAKYLPSSSGSSSMLLPLLQGFVLSRIVGSCMEMYVYMQATQIGLACKSLHVCVSPSRDD